MSEKKVDKWHYEVATYPVVAQRTIMAGANSESREFQLGFSGPARHAEFIRDRIIAHLDGKGFSTSYRVGDNDNTVIFRHRKGGATGIDKNPVGSVALRDAIHAVAAQYPTPEHIDLAMRQAKARDTQRSDAAQFTDRNAAARALLGTPGDLQAELARTLENAGPEITIGGRVNFDIDSDAGRNFLNGLAETLLANTAERLSTSAAHAILGKSTRKISGPS